MMFSLGALTVLVVAASPCDGVLDRRPDPRTGGFGEFSELPVPGDYGLHWMPGLVEAVVEARRFGSGSEGRLTFQDAVAAVCPDRRCPPEPFAAEVMGEGLQQAAVFVPRADGSVGVLIAAMGYQEYHCTSDLSVSTTALSSGWVRVHGTYAPPRVVGTDERGRRCEVDVGIPGCMMGCFHGKKVPVELLLHAPTGRVWDVASPRAAKRIVVREGTARLGRCVLPVNEPATPN